MKTIITIALLCAATQAMAVNKCLIDGKISYQNAPCPAHATQQQFEGTVSSVNSDRVREQVQEKRYQDAMAQIQYERQLQAQQEMAIQAQQIQQNNRLEEKIDAMHENVNKTKREAARAERNSRLTHDMVQQEIWRNNFWNK